MASAGFVFSVAVAVLHSRDTNSLHMWLDSIMDQKPTLASHLSRRLKTRPCTCISLTVTTRSYESPVQPIVLLTWLLLMCLGNGLADKTRVTKSNDTWPQT